MTIEELELEAFRQIRRKVKNAEDDSSNDEIAGYIKGIVDLETELYSMILKELRISNSSEKGDKDA